MKETLKESIKYLNSYGKVTNEIITQIQKHAEKYKLKEEVCAWYKNMDDFYSDWCSVGVGYTKAEVKERFNEGKKSGEFQIIKGFGIIRYAI